MKKKLFLSIGMILVALCVAAAWVSGTRSSPAVAEPASGCTVFTVSKGEHVYFGGNDDYFNPDSYYWVDPGYKKNYGAIWIG